MLRVALRLHVIPCPSKARHSWLRRPRRDTARFASSRVPLIDRLRAHGDRVAVVSFEEKSGRRISSTYRQILSDARRIASRIRETLPRERGDDAPPRIGVLMPRDRHYVSCMTAVWLSRAIFVPIHTKHPLAEVQYILQDSAASLLLVHPELRHLVPRPDMPEPGGGRGCAALPAVLEVDLSEPSRLRAGPEEVLPEEEGPGLDDGALLIYTSGTTGRPKGVLSSHRVLGHQIASLVRAWNYHHTDRILHLLPLHHLHGLLNKLLCLLWAGGTVEFAHDIRPEAVWRRLSEAEGEDGRLSLFMAVPTIYARMMHVYRQGGGAGGLEAEVLDRAVQHLRGMRLVVSGSAALPQGLFRDLSSLIGDAPLERYGMTELGMVLTNPLEPPSRRTPGHVGGPMPGVSVRMVDPETGRALGQQEQEAGQAGELRVKGPTVFSCYWGRPQATREAFDEEGWFKTGDMAVYSSTHDSFQLLGRLSSDIIKTGGYKVSALEVEEAIREHPQVLEAVVLGRADPVWGEVITAVLRTADGPALDLDGLRAFLSPRLAPYKLPSRLHLVHDIPKNAMGKVNKKTLLQAVGIEQQ